MKKRSIHWVAGCALMFGVVGAQATIIFNFNNGVGLDDAGAGATMTAIDDTTTDSRTITSVAVTDALGAATQTNIKSSWNALGIRGGTDNFSFELDETWVFEFDQDVKLVALDMSGVSDTMTINISSSDFADIVYTTGTSSGDTIDLGSVLVSGGTDITLTTTAVSTDPTWRMPYLSVEAIPEPATFGLLGISTVALLVVRRFQI